MCLVCECLHACARQSRAVLRIVTLHALPLPPPHLLPPPPPPLEFIPFPNVCCAPSSFLSCYLPSSLPSSCLSHAASQLAGSSTSHVSIGVSQQLFCFKGRQGHPFSATLLCPPGLLSSHMLFILQVTTLCRWSISTSRGSSATTSSRPTSPS